MSRVNMEFVAEAAARIFDELGPYHAERTYQNALKIELDAEGGVSQTEVVVPIYYRGQYVGFQRLDLVWDECIIEVKAVAKEYAKDVGQCERYARMCQKDVILVNFSPTAATVTVTAFRGALD
jgi:GxxExxY protein